MKFYIARNTIAITPYQTKKRCYEMWQKTVDTCQLNPGQYTLCKDVDGFNYEVIQVLGTVQ